MADDIIVRVRAEGVDDFTKQLKKAGVTVEKTGDKVEKESDKMGKSFKKIGSVIGAAFATQQLIQFTKQMVKLGVELDATEAKYKKVFGNSAKAVENFAKKNATSLGLTVSEYKRAAAAAGDLLIPIGFQRAEAAKLSSGLVNLSGALSAWSGGQLKATEVSQILTKALLGEREQLKTLGINIMEADVSARLLEKGQKKLTGTMLAQAKATATLELIYEKSQDAQAAFADGTQTLAEKQLVAQANFKQLADDLAQRLIPVYSKVLDIVNELSEKSELSTLIKELGEQDINGLKASKETLLLLQAQLEEKEKAGDITFTEAFALTNKIPKALKEINKLENDRSKIQATRRGGGGAEARTALLAEQALKTEAERVQAEKDRIAAAKEYEKLQKKIEKLWRSTLKITESTTSELSNATTELRALQEALKPVVDLAKEYNDAMLGDQALQIPDIVAETTKAWEEQARVRKKDNEDEATAAALKEERIQKAAAGIEAIGQAQSLSANIVTQAFNNQLRALQEKNEKGLISDKEYDKKRSEILTKQAKADKANAVFQILINTASAIVKSLPNLILAGISAGLGAVQLASVIAQPIPKFAKGTKGSKTAPKGFAWVGEEGPELMQMKGGEKVVTAGDSEEIMRILAGYSIPVQFKRTEEELYKPMRSIKDFRQGAKGIDWNPLLDSNYKGMKYHGRKLDRLHNDLMMLNRNLGRKMTAN